MIAVAGRLEAGPAVEIARRTAATGTATELVVKAPAGEAGDRRLLELGAANVGHAAALRSATEALEPADLQLALRYLPDVRVVVLASDATTLLGTAAEAAAWSNAAMIVVTDPVDTAQESGDSALDAPDAIVLAGPTDDRDGAFAGLVAALAVRLDAGGDPAAAWRQVTADLAVDEVSRSVARRSGRPG